MTHAGKILHKVNERLILARAKKAPKTDSKVYDADGKIIGSVYEVFGPVKNPYILIKVSNEKSTPKIKRDKVYFEE
ncbi:MAG: Gar1/Naf1 family protein [archaeon YNP-WB-040]|nr:Gar1/Naf1 family protein [Candidatus Culexarchaeum yellowstonense]